MGGWTEYRAAKSHLLPTYESDDDIRHELRARSTRIKKHIFNMVLGKTQQRLLIISGPPATMKTTTVRHILDIEDVRDKCDWSPGDGSRRDWINPMTGQPEFKSRFRLTGSVTVARLHEILYEFSVKGEGVIPDDVDPLLFNPEVLAMLNAGFDTTRRPVERSTMRDNAGVVPPLFYTEGFCIVLTNQDLPAAAKKSGIIGRNIAALLSRADYIDTGLRDPRKLAIFNDDKARLDVLPGIVAKMENGDDKRLTPEEIDAVMACYYSNEDRWRYRDLRTIAAIGRLCAESVDGDWRADALLAKGK